MHNCRIAAIVFYFLYDCYILLVIQYVAHIEYICIYVQQSNTFFLSKCRRLKESQYTNNFQIYSQYKRLNLLKLKGLPYKLLN